MKPIKLSDASHLHADAPSAKLRAWGNAGIAEQISRATMVVALSLFLTACAQKEIVPAVPYPIVVGQPREAAPCKKIFVEVMDACWNSPAARDINFRSGSWAIDSAEREKMDWVIAASKLKSAGNIPHWMIVAHTDSVGNAKANLLLSRKRSYAARRYLLSHGVSLFESPNVKIESRGQTQPVADNRTAAGRRKNRRVELVYVQVCTEQEAFKRSHIDVTPKECR